MILLSFHAANQYATRQSDMQFLIDRNEIGVFDDASIGHRSGDAVAAV